ncbi:transcription elongation factor SPT4-A-like [Diabrotica virgifera virgifera]|uniref:Transcription elongation factor SPT4 n=1 Tax=Diabrotica virgifera virgifera TaxID=50390 RepID=A0A6P7FLK7_DIAVI|nr:transcription elongation factor SPT4-A-like [Diabrotica virgifera virgifera]
MSTNIIPDNLQDLRACLVCSLIKTIHQFKKDGCNNCETFLKLKNNTDNIYDCTSSNFKGTVCMMNSKDSWVCKWQRIQEFSPGMYAISVCGRLPKAVIRDMRNRGVSYKNRDTSS